MLDRERLRRTFDRLMQADAEGVAGVLRIDGLSPGPTLGLTILTHGNEPSGLAAAAAVLAFADAGWRPKCGAVVVVVNNPMAAERWFAAKDDAERLAARLVDRDMNRLPVQLDGSSSAREVKRAIELLPTWRTFDVALDIHSVGQESPPMIVEGYGDSTAFTRAFPIAIVIRAIAEIQIGAPAFAFYGAPAPGQTAMSAEQPGGCISFEIETGWHEGAQAMERAALCTRLLLDELGMKALEEERPAALEREIYHVAGSMTVPNAGYRLTQVFPTFHPCRKGDLIAVGPGPAGKGLGPVLAAPLDGHIIFAPRDVVPPTLTGEVMFFTRPVVREPRQ
jgi:predicted deacylase